MLFGRYDAVLVLCVKRNEKPKTHGEGSSSPVCFHLYSCKPSFQVRDNIVDVFRADGEPDRVRFDTLIEKLFFGEL